MVVIMADHKPSRFKALSRKGMVALFSAVIVVCLLVTIAIIEVRRNMSPLINESIELSDELMSQGTTSSASVHGVIRIDDARIGVMSAKLNDGVPEVHLNFSSGTPPHPAVSGYLKLGEHLELSGTGTVYLIVLSSFSNTQQITILFIPA